jgi:hypothetical protein
MDNQLFLPPMPSDQRIELSEPELSLLEHRNQVGDISGADVDRLLAAVRALQGARRVADSFN